MYALTAHSEHPHAKQESFYAIEIQHRSIAIWSDCQADYTIYSLGLDERC